MKIPSKGNGFIYKLHGGTKRGTSYYNKILKCQRIPKLDEQLINNLTHIGGATGIGIITHAYLDLFYQGKFDEGLDTNDIVFVNRQKETVNVDEFAISEAERLFTWYAGEFSRYEMGTVVGTEIEIKPENYAQGYDKVLEAIKAPAGFDWTGAIDLMVNVTPEVINTLKQSRGIQLAETGVYVVDHKTERANTGTLVDRYLHSTQMTAYMLAARALGHNVVGALVNIIIKTRVPKSIMVPISFPTKLEENALEGWWGAVAHAMQYPEGVNPSNCFFPSVCHHFESGACNRY